MTAQHQHLNHAAGAEPDDAPAVIVTLETLSERADLVHRNRLAVAALRHEQAELADEVRLREAQAYLTVQGEGKNEAERKAKHTLTLASDADYQRLVQRERAIKRAILERRPIASAPPSGCASRWPCCPSPTPSTCWTQR